MLGNKSFRRHHFTLYPYSLYSFAPLEFSPCASSSFPTGYKETHFLLWGKKGKNVAKLKQMKFEVYKYIFVEIHKEWDYFCSGFGQIPLTCAWKLWKMMVGASGWQEEWNQGDKGDLSLQVMRSLAEGSTWKTKWSGEKTNSKVDFQPGHVEPCMPFSEESELIFLASSESLKVCEPRIF